MTQTGTGNAIIALNTLNVKDLLLMLKITSCRIYLPTQEIKLIDYQLFMH